MTVEDVEESEFLVEVPGGQLFVKQWASEDMPARPPFVLLHDSIGCVEMWRDFPRYLAQRLDRPVIAYDRLGFGRSSPRQGPLSARFVSEEADASIPAIQYQLGIDTFLPFGHSVGGAMAVAIAASLPGSCVAVISESSQAIVEERTLEAIAVLSQKFSATDELSKLERYHGDKARWVVDSWAGAWLSTAFRGWHLREELSRLKCPLLTIHGDQDEYGSSTFSEAAGANRGVSAAVVLEACGHVPHREQPGAVVNAVQKFMEQFLI